MQNITISSKTLQIKLIVSKKNSLLFFDKATNTLKIKKINNESNTHNNNLCTFLKNWNTAFIQKIKFTGKGFKITKQKKNKTLKLFFGKSHMT
jgi:ribosomal protein L6P/L9E